MAAGPRSLPAAQQHGARRCARSFNTRMQVAKPTSAVPEPNWHDPCAKISNALVLPSTPRQPPVGLPTHVSAHRDEPASACRHTDLPHLEGKAGGGTLCGGVVAARWGDRKLAEVGARGGHGGLHALAAALPVLPCCHAPCWLVCHSRTQPALPGTCSCARPVRLANAPPETVLRLGHADGQVCKALPSVLLQRRLCLRAVLNAASAVDVGGDALDLGLQPRAAQRAASPALVTGTRVLYTR